jgi:hypothetical protein
VLIGPRVFLSQHWPGRSVYKAGGSRECPSVSHLHRFFRNHRIGSLGENVARGNSREPPVFANDEAIHAFWTNTRGPNEWTPKRLPSTRWRVPYKRSRNSRLFALGVSPFWASHSGLYNRET